MKKNVLILVVAMLLSVANSWAQSGTCGANLTWVLNGTTLTVSGNGAMNDYNQMGDLPWYPYQSSITDVIIREGVTTIGRLTFAYCFDLTAVTIPSSVTTIGNSAFVDCGKLTAVTIPNSVKTIGYQAFAHCTGLSSITIPNSVTTIDGWAFLACSRLSTVTISNSVTTIEDGTFYGCDALTAVTIPSGVTAIGNSAFFECDSLISITISENITTIGEGAFAVCTALSSINVNDNNTHYSSENGILFDKSKTTLVQYPAGKTDGVYIIPNSVTAIGEYAFARCSNISAVTIPNSVTTIGDWAFAGCSGIAYIGTGNATFYYTYLKEVTVAWTTPLDVPDGIFSEINTSIATLRVPAGTKALYQAAPVWKDFGAIVEYNPDGNENIHTPTLKAFASNNILYISGLQPGKPVHIYSLSGQVVYKGLAKAEMEAVPVAARGIYIVAAGAQTVKVISN